MYLKRVPLVWRMTAITVLGIAMAALGTALAMLQLLVYSVLARQGLRTIWFVWLALAGLVGGGLMTDSLVGLLTVVISVDLTLLVILLGLSYHLLRRPVPATEAPLP